MLGTRSERHRVGAALAGTSLEVAVQTCPASLYDTGRPPLNVVVIPSEAMDEPPGSSPTSGDRLLDTDVGTRVDATLELLARARAGDHEALNRLFARYLPSLRRWASGRLPHWSRD